MLELKLASGAEKLYRAVLRFAVRLAYRRDQRNYNRYMNKLQKAETLRNVAKSIKRTAMRTEDEAGIYFDRQQSKIKDALNALRSAQNNLPPTI